MVVFDKLEQSQVVKKIKDSSREEKIDFAKETISKFSQHLENSVDSVQKAASLHVDTQKRIRSPSMTDQFVTPAEDVMIEGIVYANHRSFLGIPYATAGRFQMPKSVPFTSQRAVSHGDHCPQLKIYRRKGEGRDVGARQLFEIPKLATVGGKMEEDPREDCLNLNIHTPLPSQLGGRRVPVMVFVHGGSLMNGANSMPLYDPSVMVSSQGDLVVVTINYRFGPFGFLTMPEPDTVTGNYGIFDIIEALRWVQTNIGAFGGDPDNVTLAGFSAGAVLVNWVQLWAGGRIEEAVGLFHKVILFSGNHQIIPARTYDEALSDTLALARHLKCPVDEGSSLEETAKCLRHSVTARQIVEAAHRLKIRRIWAPVIDGIVFTDGPRKMIQDGQIFPVPTLLTTTQNEGTALVDQVVKPVIKDLSATDPLEDYEQFIQKVITDLAKAPKIYQTYMPTANTKEAVKAAIAQLMTDALFKCPAIRYVGQLKSQGIPASHQEWTRIPSLLKITSDLGVFHGSDLMYLFGGVHQELFLLLEQKYADQYRKMIVSFMRTGKVDGETITSNIPMECALLSTEDGSAGFNHGILGMRLTVA